MFSFGKKKDKDSKKDVQTQSSSDSPDPHKKSFFTKLQQSLQKTRNTLTASISKTIFGKKIIDSQLIEDIETLLLTADVGLEATDEIIQDLTNRLHRNALKDPEAVLAALKTDMHRILSPYEKPLTLNENGLTVLLMVGVNGAGKTTTIGKLAKRFQRQGKKVMLAAGDTFRAAAVEQLKVWGERNNIPVIAQHDGADSASVVYDAMEAARARNIDVLIADTAGRLHTQNHLMEELKKVVRVIKKLDQSAPHETMLILDASIGQNALIQAEKFHDAINVSGICMTKLDGTAKGGIVFAIANKLKLPLRFIGVGESIDDLRPFSAEDFIAALFDNMDSSA